jgi:hypothetical protein
MADQCHVRAGGGEKKRLKAVALHLVGDGPQPPEGILSIVCDAFGCTPDVARRQDWDDVKSILDYRLAVAAKDQHNRKVEEMTPEMVRIWKEMIEAANEVTP